MDSTKETAIRNEVQKSYLGKYEEIFRENANKEDFSLKKDKDNTLFDENSKNNGENGIFDFSRKKRFFFKIQRKSCFEREF